MSLSKSVLFEHLYRKLHNRNWRNFLRKGRIKSLVSRWSVPFEFTFCRGKTRFTHATAANKRANSHNFKTKNLNLLTITFLTVYLMNRGKSWYMNESSMRVNNTFRWITECFWREYCRQSPCQTSSVVFQMFLHFFFLTRSLIDRCQIITDNCKNNVSKFVWKPFKSPLSLRKWKCFGEASLFNLHHLYFNYHLLAHCLVLWKILP